MFSSRFWRRIILIGFVSLMAVPATAQSRRGRYNTAVKIGVGGLTVQQIQTQVTNVNNQIQQVEKPLQDAKEKLVQEQQAFHKVDLEFKQSLREVSQARKLAEQEAKSAPELKAAQDKVEELHAQLAAVRKKVIESLLKDNVEYRATVKAHDEAVAEQKASHGLGTSEETHKALVKKVSNLAHELRTMEDVVMADHSEAKQLTLQSKDALAEVAALTKKMHDQIESDPNIASAKAGFQRNHEALANAKASMALAAGEHSRISHQLQLLNNQRASLMAQQQLMQSMQATRGSTNSSSSRSRRGR